MQVRPGDTPPQRMTAVSGVGVNADQCRRLDVKIRRIGTHGNIGAAWRQADRVIG
jgi:hypothetical protein